MTNEELLATFTKHFPIVADLDGALAMLRALLDVEVANAKASIAQANARAANEAANSVVAQAMTDANRAKYVFAELVAQAAAQDAQNQL